MSRNKRHCGGIVTFIYDDVPGHVEGQFISLCVIEVLFQSGNSCI